MSEESEDDPIGKALGVTPMSQVDKISETVRMLEQRAMAESASDDFTVARGNIHSIIESGTEALDELMMIAKQSQHPRAFEVISALIKTLVEANKDLLELQKKMRDIQSTEDGSAFSPKTINNTLVVTTAELTKMIENARKPTEE